jgi:nitrate reductase delta subunit
MTVQTSALKALGALLTYPDEVLVGAVPDLRKAIEDPAIPETGKARLRALLDYLQSSDPWDLQEAYVAQFDTGRATSLHLFEHVHGESRDRGQAMVDLKAEYEAVGLTLVPEELPDFVPAFLEFCSVIDPQTAASFLGDCAEIFRALDQRLSERGSPYAAVFGAVLAFAGEGTSAAVSEVRPELPLDEEWSEQPAFSQGVC